MITLMIMGKASFDAYMQSFDTNKISAYEWPMFIADPYYSNEIIKEPKKYVNWLVWIYITAPFPKNEKEKEIKATVENLLAECLSVEGEDDIINSINSRIYR